MRPGDMIFGVVKKVEGGEVAINLDQISTYETGYRDPENTTTVTMKNRTVHYVDMTRKDFTKFIQKSVNT